MLSKDYLSSIVATLRLISVEHIQIVSSFFLTTDMLAEYRLLLDQIIPLLSKSCIFCFICFCIPGSKDFGLAVIGKGCIRLILCLRTFVLPKLLLCWAITFLNWSSNLLTDVGN